MEEMNNKRGCDTERLSWKQYLVYDEQMIFFDKAQHHHKSYSRI